MELIINGNKQEATCATLADLLEMLEYDGDWLATAVNGELVHRDNRTRHALAEGDRIEILSPMQGG